MVVSHYATSNHLLSPTRYTVCRAFLTTLNELNDYAGQHEVIAENLTSQIITELSRFLQELKSERKSVRHCVPFTIGCNFCIFSALFLGLHMNFVPIILYMLSDLFLRQSDICSIKEYRNTVLQVFCFQHPLTVDCILHKLRSALNKCKYTQRLTRGAERDRVIFVEQSHCLCIVTGLFLSSKQLIKNWWRSRTFKGTATCFWKIFIAQVVIICTHSSAQIQEALRQIISDLV